MTTKLVLNVYIYNHSCVSLHLTELICPNVFVLMYLSSMMYTFAIVNIRLHSVAHRSCRLKIVRLWTTKLIVRFV